MGCSFSSAKGSIAKKYGEHGPTQPDDERCRGAVLTIRAEDAEAVRSEVLDGMLELGGGGGGRLLELPLPAGVDLRVCRAVIRCAAAGVLPEKPRTVAEALEMRSSGGRWARACAFLDAWHVYPHCPSDVDFMAALEATCPAMHATAVRDRTLRCTDLAFASRAAPYVDLVEVTADALAQRPFEYDASLSQVIRGEAPFQAPSFAQLAPMKKWLLARFGGAHWFDGSVGLVVAGGFPLASLFGKVGFSRAELPSDIDVFCCVSPQVARMRGVPAVSIVRDLVTGLVEALRASWTIVCITAPGKPPPAAGPAGHTGHAAGPAGPAGHAAGPAGHVLNVAAKDPSTGNVVKIQVVLAAFETPAHVVHGFDLAPCKVLFDGRRVMATRSALSCLQTGVFLFDETTMSKSMEHRVAKFVRRYGFGAFVPGVPGDTLINNDANIVSRVAQRVLLGPSSGPDAHQSDYGDDGLVAQLTQEHGARLTDSHLQRVVDMSTRGRAAFTGAFNPVRESIFKGMDAATRPACETDP